MEATKSENDLNESTVLTQERLDNAFQSALDESDIRDGIADSGRKEEYFEQQIRDRAPEVARAVAKEMEVLESANEMLQEAKSKLDMLEKQKPLSPTKCNSFFITTISVIIFWGLIILLLYGRLRLGSWLAGFQIKYLFYFVLLVVCTFGFWVIIFLRARKRYPVWINDKGNREKHLKSVEKHHSEANRKFMDRLTRRGIMPILRPLIEDARRPNYSRTLGEIAAPGLAEVYDQHYKVYTQAKHQLDERLEKMPGGSIGIAGPRGSGKTTLVRSFCDDGSWKLGHRSVLSIMIPAPIEYEARDFVLHIFSRICRKLLEIKKVPEREWNPLIQPIDSSEKLRKILLPFQPLQRILIILGTTLLLCYLALGLLEFTAQLQKPQEIAIPEKTKATESNADNGQSPVAPNDIETAPTPKSSGSPDEPETSLEIAQTLSRFAKAFGLKPTTFLHWGLLLFVPGLALYYIDHGIRSGDTTKVHISKQEIDEPKDETDEPKDETDKPEDKLVQHAQDHSDQIKFQESYTSGWSGALNLPLGMTAGLSGAVTRSTKPLSLPEIVTCYREFIGELTQKDFTVIIGIDELDKMESDRKAQRFLNDIKMIFGLEHCFYFISVSKSAMNTFERRGLPFRNVFDSSFDEIVYVEYLDFKQAVELIKKRVIGMPMPCKALCYCLSGGLARDLIRTCRYALDEPKKAEKKLSINQLCERMLELDIKTKLRALEDAAENLKLEQEIASFITELREIEQAPIKSRILLARAKALFAKIPEPANEMGQSNSSQKNRQTLAYLYKELATYLFYCATLRQFFTSRFGKSTLEHVRIDGSLDHLSKARQAFAVNPGVARLMLENVRRKRKMKPISI